MVHLFVVISIVLSGPNVFKNHFLVYYVAIPSRTEAGSLLMLTH